MPEDKPLISIIVPIYNVEKYLNKCVDSILNQTFTDFELILVDDESPDNCGKICDDYAGQDKRVKVIHKKNGGLSDARNAGIKIALADYISFVDSDDYIENNLLEILFHLIRESDADISSCGVMNCYNDHQTPQYGQEETFVVDNRQAYQFMMEGKKIPGSSCGKLYKRYIFENFQFVKGKKYEDAFLFSDIMPFIKKMAVTTKPLYNYLHREGSYTTTFKEKEYDIIEAYDKNLKTVRDNFPDLIEQALFRYYWAHFIVLDHMLLMDNYRTLNGYKEMVSFLKKHAVEIYKNRYFNKSRRISALCLLANIRIYRFLLIKNTNKNVKLAN